MLTVKIIALVLGLVGLLGCILPVLPGPPLSYAGLALLYFCANGSEGTPEISGRFMFVWFVIMAAVTILDYIIPAWFTKITGGSSGASRGTIAGMLIGFLFFPPIGIIAGAFIGAIAGEIMIGGKNIGSSIVPAFGSLLGFIFGTGIKTAASGVMFYYIIKFL